MKILAVIDMQKDFIDGALGTAEAEAIVGSVAERIREYRAAGDEVVFTRDTHTEQYLSTQEGRNLPVPHCIKGTPDWQIDASLDVADSEVFDKPSFGSRELADYIAAKNPEAVELVGLCTDICVISNAMLIKAAAPELPVSVNAVCCAGVTPQSHLNALAAMKMCQISIINEA